METQMKASQLCAALRRRGRELLATIICVLVLCTAASAERKPLQTILDLAAANVTAFLDTISDVNCTEHVTQEKIGDNGKTMEKRESDFDYIVLLSNAGGELTLSESRVAADSNKEHKEKLPLLVSNGFSMLLLIFHPYYSAGFQFSFEPGQNDPIGEVTQIHFQHIPGARSPAALALRGREYPLDISGTAWIDTRTGVIDKITVRIGNEMEDIGLHALLGEIEYAPVSFQTAPGTYWLPAHATVEVQSRHQHWRNTHVFSAYKRFSVKTKEQVSQP
jgi:hypothetical protein